MKFTLYLFFALLPLLGVLAHDYYVNYEQSFAFTSVGYHIYNYAPSLFYWIKDSFAQSAGRELIAFFMKSHLVIYCLLLSGPAALYVIQSKQQNRGPFRQYLNEIPKMQKKWLSKENLASRFSGGKVHESSPHQYKSGE
jgi:hypothetical protein